MEASQHSDGALEATQNVHESICGNVSTVDFELYSLVHCALGRVAEQRNMNTDYL